jgi:CheY-like chemotaxis protein
MHEPGLRILVVDDDDDLRQVLVELLQAWGYGTRQARNGREALGELDSFTPALVLLDLMMPDINGWQFVDAVANRDPKVNIVVITASHASDAPPGYPVLQKPMDVAAVKRAVELSLHL